MAATRFLVALVTVSLSCPWTRAQGAEPDRDRDRLPDHHEVHKYLTDPGKADSDGDGVPDGDWGERREYQYTVRTVVQVMRPVTIEWLTDDFQDARVLDETADYVELEVIHYPFTKPDAIAGDAGWRDRAARMRPWTAPGPTADWTPQMRADLLAALQQDGIDAGRLDDKALVEQAAKWLCRHAQYQDCFTTFVTAFDAQGRPHVPDDLRAAVPNDAEAMAQAWRRDISARGMFELGRRGSCTSSAIYLNGCLRALGVPTRIVLCIPVVDANDDQELRLLELGLRHHELRRQVLGAVRGMRGSWASHTFNEVYVDRRWRRLNFDRLGQGIADPDLFGLITHVATFSDWADARMPETIGRRQTLRRHNDVFGGGNPYSTIAVRDQFGRHCALPNPTPAQLVARVTAAHWGDSKDVPEEVRRWFAEHEVFGLVARVEGIDGADALREFLEVADKRVLLVADGKPTLGVGLDPGNWWFRDRHALVVVPFGAADRRDLVAGVPYRFVPRNDARGAAWQVDALQVVRRE